MKKYRITSIPQSLSKAQTGKSIKEKREDKLKMKTQKYGSKQSKQKDSDLNYGKTDYKGGNLEYNFADAFHNSIYNDENPYPNFDKVDPNFTEKWWSYISGEEARRLNDIQQQEEQEYYQQEDERINNYYTDFIKSKKSDKIKPLYENVDLTSEQIDEYKNTNYIEKNNDGTYSLWPKDLLQDKIVNNGFKEHQFKNWWGLDGEQVREQMGEFIDWREDVYDESMINKIYTTAIQEDKSFDQVINELTESGKQGNAAAMKKKYLPQLTDFITKQYDEAFVNPPISPSPVPDGKFKYNEPETKSYPEFDWTDVSGYHRLDGNERHKNKIVFDTPVTKEDFKVEDIYSKHSGKEKKLWDINLSDQKYNEWWINQGGTEAGKQNRLVKLDRINRTTLEDYTDKEKREVIKLYNDSQPKQDLPPPNDYGLYNMAGNVNEWDVDNDKLKTFTESDLIPRPNARFSGYDMSYNPELSDEDLLKILQNNKSDKLTGKSESFLKYMANLKKEEGDKISNNAFSNKDISNDDKLHILSNMFKTSTESDNKNLDANVLEKRDGTNIFNLDSKETDWGNPYDWDSNTYGTYPFADLDSWGSDATKNAETNKLSFSDQYDELYSIDSYTNDLWNKRNKKLNLKTPSKDERTWYTDTWDVVSNLSDAVLAGLDPNKGFWDASNDPRLPRANMTYNEVKEFQRLNSYIDKNGNINDYGDLTAGWGDRLNTASGAMTIPLKLLEGLNPFHIIDEKSRDNSWSRNIDLGIDAAESAAFIIPGAKVATSSIRGLSGLSKFNKFRKAGSAFGKSFGNKEVLKDIGKAYWNYPLHGYGAHALRPEGYMAQGIEDFQKGDYGSGAFNIGMSAPFIPSYLKKAVNFTKKTVPLAKAILDPRVNSVGVFNPKTNYGFGFSNPKGKEIFYGNAGANDPVFSKSYFPKTRDKIFDKTGFEIDFRKKIDPSGYRYTSSSFPQLNKEELLLKKFGGELPEARWGDFIKYLGKSKNYLKNFIKGKPINELNISQIEKKPRTIKIADDLKWTKRDQISDIGGFEFGPAQETIQNLINQKGIKNLDELDEMLAKTLKLGKGSLLTNSLTKFKGHGIDDFDFKPMSPGAIEMQKAKLLAADVKGPGFARSTDFPSPMNDEHKRLFHQYKSAPLEEMSDLIRKGMIKKFGSDKVLKYAVNNLEENRRLGPQGYYGKFKPLTRNEIGANLLGVLDDSSPILKYNYRLNELVNQYNRYIKMGIDPNKPGMLSLQDKIKNFPRKKHHHFDKWDKFSGKDINLRDPLIMNQKGGQLPKAQTGLSSLAKLIKTGGKNYSKFNLGKDVYKYTPNFTKNILRGINTSTLGTANAIAKTIAPVMINPLTFGLSVEEFGPFTGSPLNFIPFYGKTLPSSENKNPGVAYRKFGDNLDYVKNTGIISPAHGRKFRMGKEQIQGEGNWAEMGNINEKYPGVFAASFDTNVPGTNINITDGRELNRNGVLVREGNNFTGTVPYNSIMDPGVKLHRRLPFSNKYVDVNMDKLRGDKFDPATMGGNLQSLLERYGYAAGIAGGLGLAGINIPQEYLDEYVNNPIKENYIKLKGLFDKPIKKEKDGGMVVNLSQKEIDQYAKEGWIIEDV